ncbi:MAG: L-threonylcarbamoyladenylate synthase [Bacillota bacterium]
MITRYFKIDPVYPNIMVLKMGAEIIIEGGIVAFPTETVYGLGADGLNEDALERIFFAKGRPMDNPLILHISSIKNVRDVASYVPLSAKKAMRAFWPGPLTVVLPKSYQIPDEVTAGLPTVAVRMPAHPLALKLIKLARVPVAAPSANLSGRPSPTTGLHVLRDLKGKIEMIIDGGPARWGIESTVVDFTSDVPTILRPGAVTREMLEAVIGPVAFDKAIYDKESTPKSPGVKYIHYAPRGEMFLIKGEDRSKVTEKIRDLVKENQKLGKKVAVLASEETCIKMQKLSINPDYMASLGSTKKLEMVASRIYSLLRNCDKLGMDIILTEDFPEEGIGAAVMNRLIKACGHKILKI